MARPANHQCVCGCVRKFDAIVVFDLFTLRFTCSKFGDSCECIFQLRLNQRMFVHWHVPKRCEFSLYAVVVFFSASFLTISRILLIVCVFSTFVHEYEYTNCDWWIWIFFFFYKKFSIMPNVACHLSLTQLVQLSAICTEWIALENQHRLNQTVVASPTLHHSRFEKQLQWASIVSSAESVFANFFSSEFPLLFFCSNVYLVMHLKFGE